MKCITCPYEAWRDQRCKPCIIKHAEKRIRTMIRTTTPVNKGDVLFIQDHFCELIIKDIVQGLPYTIQREKSPEKGLEKTGRDVLSWTMDDELEQFLENLFYNKELIVPEKSNTIKLFISLTDKEFNAFAAAKGFPEKPQRNTKYEALLNAFEERHKETRYSLAKSIAELRSILQSSKN